MINLRNYNTYKVNTTASYMYEPTTIKELTLLLDNLKKTNTKYFILGGGSNVILPDNHFDGAIIKLAFDSVEIKDNTAFVSSSSSLSGFIKHLVDLGYTNLVNLYGIPGTVGGAIHGNAGANNTEIFDYLESVLVYQDGDVKLINAKNIKHSYRYAQFADDIIILRAVFTLVKGSSKEAWEIIKINLEKRKNSQPLEYPQAGSVFKNPEKTSAGKLIDECGLKGLRVGDAMVSEKHANFIINLGSATSDDIIKLINKIKEEVKRQKGINLELEQKIIKW